LNDHASGTQLDIVVGKLIIGDRLQGRANCDNRARSVGCWTYLTARPPGFEHHGRAETLEKAKFSVERNSQAWLDAAGLVERE
jgi:hypothetical protein